MLTTHRDGICRLAAVSRVSEEDHGRRPEGEVRGAGVDALGSLIYDSGLERLPRRDGDPGRVARGDTRRQRRRARGRREHLEGDRLRALDPSCGLCDRVVCVVRGAHTNNDRGGVVVLDGDRLHDARAALHRGPLDRARDRQVPQKELVGRAALSGGEGRGDGGDQGHEEGRELHCWGSSWAKLFVFVGVRCIGEANKGLTGKGEGERRKEKGAESF